MKTRFLTMLILTIGLALTHSSPAISAAPLPQASCTLPATVTTADELSDCITAANAGAGGTITLGADIDLTTLTTSPLPQITSAIVLEGAGYAIDGGDSVGIFEIGASGDFTVNQATLQNGFATVGGAIDNYRGRVTVTNSTFSGNRSDVIAGGGINNDGTLTVINSTFSGNSAGNTGGAVINHITMTVINSTFSGNSAGNSGGAVINYNTMTVTHSTFSGNAANSGGGIQNLSNSTVHLAGTFSRQV